MKCPYCGEENTKVIDSRPSEENNAIRRRRQCEKCKKRFTTYEKVETIPLIVIKKDNITTEEKSKQVFFVHAISALFHMNRLYRQ